MVTRKVKVRKGSKGGRYIKSGSTRKYLKPTRKAGTYKRKSTSTRKSVLR